MMFRLWLMLVAGILHVGVAFGQITQSVVAVIPKCNAGVCPNGSPNPGCTIDADCDRGSVSPKSSAKVTRAGVLLVRLRGVRGPGPGGALITTDGILGSDDDFVVIANLADASPDRGTLRLGYPPFIFKTDLTNGAANLAIDLLALGAQLGDHALLSDVALWTPPGVPANCPGDNSPAAILARQGDGDCDLGNAFIGATGVELR